ncbi:hypothetical protein [Burkholderia gladioli]|uniref:GAP1-N1 domain-containing protein n=1 Tax=Burkholderia gladioli TaxID=28095 RepID=UPI000F541419|nr:hypothetical protein [Burkholderia gladioli]MBU9270266.1 hypothetical protein [Burkholderia gladioli]MBU9273040.1 hypothetical protein [Burkholderia gladioli]
MQIEQCIFGYDDGHRLIASSLRLTGNAASELTHLSDLAPGVSFGESDGYWTGMPFPKLGKYVLMKTWPAPEMPRPGCVWTHALLIEPKLFEFVQELSTLWPLMRRPISIGDNIRYEQPLEIADLNNSATVSATFDGLQRGGEILEFLYSPSIGAVVVEKPGELDATIFAVWSQQWPRLRRNFRFQTAAMRENTARSNIRFDLKLVLGSANRQPSSSAPWVIAARADLAESADGNFRNFIWRYGQDVKKQKSSFRPLSELFVINKHQATEMPAIYLPGLLETNFPDPDDAVIAKQDVVDGRILEKHQVDILAYLLQNPEQNTFPMPSDDGIKQFAKNWPERSGEILALAEKAIVDPSELAQQIAQVALNSVPASSFWSLTDRHPKIRRQLLRQNPSLLDSNAIDSLDASEIADLLPISSGNPALAENVIGRLLNRNDFLIARTAFEHFGNQTVLLLIERLDRTDDAGLSEWLRMLSAYPNLLLKVPVMSTVRRTTTLLILAEALDWLSADVLRSGTEPWQAALAQSRSDLPQDDTDILRAFLISLSLATGGPAAAPMLEECFEPLHDRILHSFLPWKASELLLPVLPSLGWGWNWDVALRLRLAVAQAYVTFGLEPESFARLARERRVQKMLAEAAEKISGGGRYTKALQ